MMSESAISLIVQSPVRVTTVSLITYRNRLRIDPADTIVCLPVRSKHYSAFWHRSETSSGSVSGYRWIWLTDL